MFKKIKNQEKKMVKAWKKIYEKRKIKLCVDIVIEIYNNQIYLK